MGVVTVDETPKSLASWLLIFFIRLQAHFHLSDVVLGTILRFLGIFFTVLGRFSSVCAEIAHVFPRSVHTLTVSYGLKDMQIQRYVVCRKCHTIYFFKNCIEGHGATQRSKTCSHKAFPNHPHLRRRLPCGTLLLKSVELASQRKILYPFKIYCYLNLKCSLQSMLLIPGLGLACEQWRLRQVSTGVREDVYDGNVWKDFQHIRGQSFLSDPFALGLMLNIDWFEPYKHLTYSVGVIYLTVMNLPLTVRYKRENVLLVGIIPGPHEPSHDINSFLMPLVEDLLSFWDGVELDVHGCHKKLVRCALLCAACDHPAGRKTCGFLGHSACLGCSKCMKQFTGTVGDMNYSGFDRHNWTFRSNESHRRAVQELKQYTTRTALEEAESRLGCRYSELLKLPYFDAPRMLIIDPMHNLFLGSAKHYLKNIWLNRGIITTLNFDKIQSRVDSVRVPADIGRVPHKIMSGFASFTADQFKNWVLYYSVIVLRDLLPPDDLERWRHFVLACRLLCHHQLRLQDIQLADALLQFCRRTERMYGSNCITPNMHMHCHLKSCILDYGPLHGFWLFSFERFNGLLGLLPNNNRSIELQLINRFVRDNSLLCIPPPDSFEDDFTSHLPHARQGVGSVLETTHPSLSPALNLTRWGASIGNECTLPTHYSRSFFQPHEIEGLKELYSKLHACSHSSLDVPSLYMKYMTYS